MLLRSRRPIQIVSKIPQRTLFSSEDNLKNVGKLRSFFNNQIAEFKGSLLDNLTARMRPEEATALKHYWMSPGSTAPQSQIGESSIQSLPAPSTTLSPAPASPPTVDSPARPSSHSSVESESFKDVQLYHPILGELVVDVGYKRVYMTSVRSLVQAPVWEKQRILRQDRALHIANQKIKQGTQSQLPGVITFFQDTATNEIGIIDGQHRASALVHLAQRGHWDEWKRNVLIDVFSTSGDKDIVSLFKEINSAEPVLLIDIPHSSPTTTTTTAKTSGNSNNSVAPTLAAAAAVNMSGFPANAEPAVEIAAAAPAPTTTTAVTTAPKTTIDQVESEDNESQEQSNVVHVRIITASVDELMMRYAAMFKTSSRCRPPHLNPDVFRDMLFQAEVLRKYGISSSEELVATLEAVNRQLQTRSDEQWAVALGQSEVKLAPLLKKARANSFFLGLGDNSWTLRDPGQV